jgi:PAS domain-containing protein
MESLDILSKHAAGTIFMGTATTNYTNFQTNIKESRRLMTIQKPSTIIWSKACPQNIIRKDTEGKFTFANQNFCNAIGKTSEEILGKTDFDLFPSHLAAKYQEDDRARDAVATED